MTPGVVFKGSWGTHAPHPRPLSPSGGEGRDEATMMRHHVDRVTSGIPAWPHNHWHRHRRIVRCPALHELASTRADKCTEFRLRPTKLVDRPGV